MFESAPFSGVVSYAVIDAVADNATDAQWASWYESTAYVSRDPFPRHSATKLTRF